MHAPVDSVPGVRLRVVTTEVTATSEAFGNFRLG